MPKSKTVPTPLPALRRDHPRTPSDDARAMPDGRALKPEDIEKLNRVARDYEWVLFGCSQLAGMLNIHLRLITAVASHPQSPFGAAGKKARPEWVFAFLRDPPKGFASPK